MSDEEIYYVTAGATRPDRGILAIPARLATVRDGALYLTVDAIRVAGAMNPLHSKRAGESDEVPFAEAGQWAATLEGANGQVRASAQRRIKKLGKLTRAAEAVARGDKTVPVLPVEEVKPK